jgi:hypothetical protein
MEGLNEGILQMKTRLIVALAVGVLIAGPAFAAGSTTTTSGSTSGAMAASTPATAPKTVKPKATSVKTAATTHYYIAEAPNTTSCSVVTTKPDGKTMMMVGKFYYSTKAGATAAIKKMSGCK